MITEGPNGKQGLPEFWKNICLSGLKRLVLVIQECGVCGCNDLTIWNMDEERMDHFSFVAAWRVEG